MSKKNIIIASSIAVLAILLFVNRTKKVDWTPTYDETKTKPLDTKVFFDQLSHWFPSQEINTLYTTYYEYSVDLEDSLYYAKRNYISVSDNYAIDKPSFEELLYYVEQGNQAFIAAHTFPKFMQDTLGFETDYNPVYLKEKAKASYLEHLDDSLVYTLKNPYGEAFIKDTVSVDRLGYTFNEFCEEQSNFVRIPYKEGFFYLHTTPELFTNYQLLETKSSFYHDNVISFLPEHPVLFEKNIKIDPNLLKGPLSFILSKPALKWSYYLALMGMFFFMLFNAKRRQRVIPIIEPLKNTTTEFVHTLSTLHLESEDYNGMIQKNIIYFLEFVRRRYHLPTDKLNDDFIKKLAQRSGKPQEQIEQLISKILKMRSHKFSTPDPLKQLNKALEDFYTTT